MVAMGYRFRAPKAADAREWSRIEAAVRDRRDYGIPTIRKRIPQLKISPQLRI